MSESEHRAADVIDAYRRRRGRMVPLLLGGLAVVLLVVGLFLVVIWLTGDGLPSLPFLSTDTPTPTLTFTPLPPTATPTITLTPTITPTPTPSGPVTYIVESGDTLFSIAEQFGISIDQLLAYNPEIAANPNSIGVGSQIIIPAADSPLPSKTALPTNLAPGARIEYVVETGDTLQSIAAQFNSTAEAIATASKILVTDVLFVGKVLIVPVNIATPTPTSRVPSPPRQRRPQPHARRNSNCRSRRRRHSAARFASPRPVATTAEGVGFLMVSPAAGSIRRSPMQPRLRSSEDMRGMEGSGRGFHDTGTGRSPFPC
jgi:LysM repeat protein